jgi:signal transduction histidine kinase
MVVGGMEPDRPFRSSTMELEFKRKDGSLVWAEVQASFLRDPDGRPSRVIGVARDVTERRRLGEQLRQAQKMEAIGRLAGGISHDFNNVLTAIIGYSDLILHRLGEDNPVAHEITTIKLAGERAASLTRQLLTFSRRQILMPKILDLNEVVRESGKILRPLIGEDIRFQTSLDAALHPVRADHGQIVQVILNLAVNARDATSEGGTITIRTENASLDEQDCLSVPDSRPGEFACLSVADTGAGMEAATLERIFEPFFTTKGSGKGTGLGLSVVYGIVKQHNGWVNVHSAPGQGATFKVYLPAQPRTQPDQRSGAATSLQGLQGRGERILLVEDEDHVREYTKAILRENGYVIFEAANPEEALDVFRREKGYFHLVFSDVVLPGRSGVQLADQLLAQRPDVLVLLSSGYTDERCQWPVIRERGYRYLQKPYSLVDLLQTVREMVSVN